MNLRTKQNDNEQQTKIDMDEITLDYNRNRQRRYSDAIKITNKVFINDPFI